MIVSEGAVSGLLASEALPGSAKGIVLGSGSGSVEGTVSTLLVESFDKVWTSYAFKVLLNGDDVSSFIVGAVTILQDLDRLSMAEFALQGKRFSFIVTESTWTHTEVEIYFIQGLPGRMTEVQKFSGFVDRGSPEAEYVYRVTCLDLGGGSSKAKVCLEIPPEAGLTRDQIARDILLTAGFNAAQIPDMDLYNKPYNFEDESWQSIVDLLESAGYHLKVNLDGSAEAYQIKKKEIPDHIWDVSQLSEIPQIDPPSGVESALVFRGTETVTVTDSEGISIEKRSTPIFGTFNKETTHRQLSDGTIVERTFPVGSPHASFTMFQMILLVEAEIHRVGTRVVLKVEKQFGWVNPASGRYKTRSAKDGPAPQGSDYVECYVTDDGRFVVWNSARFTQQLERREEFFYDVFGTKTGSEILSYEFHRITRAVRNPVGSWIDGVLVGDDNISYARNGGGLNQIEGYGLKSKFKVEIVHDDTSGSEVGTEQTTWNWYSARTEIDNNYLRFDGQGMKNSQAFFQKVELDVENKILDVAGRIAGDVKIRSEFDVTESTIGAFDWGEFTAEDEEEVFRNISIEANSYDPLNTSQYQRVLYDNVGRRIPETFTSQVPVPLYKSSVWTEYASQPIEVILQDPILRKWFGSRTKVVNVSHAVDLQQLENLLARRHSRAISHQVKVMRLETVAKIGDTVLLVDRNQGLFHLGVVISIRDSRSYASSDSEYQIEIPLFDTGLLF